MILQFIQDFSIEFLKETQKFFSALGSIPFFVGIILLTYSLQLEKLSLFLSVGLVFLTFFGYSIRFFFFKERPKKVEHKTAFEKIKASSFPSMHISRFFFLSLTSLQFYAKKEFIIFIITLSLAIALSRILKKKHDIVDIIGGFIFATISYFILINISILSF
jgi:membrane-associated phospholipid phosphatase